MDKFSVRDEIIETINKLFVFYRYPALGRTSIREVFANLVMFDMTSVGGVKEELSAKTICEMWAKDFAGLDHVHHHAGNYLVHLHDATAHVTLCNRHALQGIRIKGRTRVFIGMLRHQIDEGRFRMEDL